MIRFVDLRKQGIGYRFAFFNTILNKFYKFNGVQVWETASEFAEDFARYSECLSTVDRFASLIPQWAKTPSTEEAET